MTGNRHRRTRDLHLDVDRPVIGAPGPLPVVVLVHGEPAGHWPDPRS